MNSYNGFSLVEALVAMAVLGTGLAGLASVMVASISTTTEASVQSRTTVWAADTLERLALPASTTIPGDLPPGVDLVACQDGSPGDGAANAPACDGAGPQVIKAWRLLGPEDNDEARLVLPAWP